jgi:nicotinamidase/pyrazinamidase
MAGQTNKTPSRLLLVVDMLKGFLDPRGSLYCGDSARAIIPFVASKAREQLSASRPVIYVCDNHEPDDPEFRMFPAHCVRGTWEAQVIDELPTRGAIVLPKHTLSCFKDTQLDARLADLRPEAVDVAGVCTNICILYAVYELLLRGLRTRVFRQGVASFDQAAHEFALGEIQRTLGAEVL